MMRLITFIEIRYLISFVYKIITNGQHAEVYRGYLASENIYENRFISIVYSEIRIVMSRDHSNFQPNNAVKLLPATSRR